jgi:UDP-glucuronate 4-epimerase
MSRWALVTGVAGFIGSHLAERLLDLGYGVIGLDNFDDCYSVAIKKANIAVAARVEGFRLVEGDIRDGVLLERIFAGRTIEVVVHLAARAGVRPSLEHPVLYQDVNIGGTINLLEASRAHRVKQFLFASSSSVYGANGSAPFREEAAADFPVSPYAASKASAELFCRTYSHLYGLPTVLLRLFTVYGPRQRPEMAIHRFVRMVDAGQEVTLFGDGSTSRDYTYVDDIVDGIEAALTHGGDGCRVFNLGAGRAVSLAYLVSVIEEALGKKAVVRHVAPPPGEVPITLADISKARAALGYEPKVSIEEGIARFVSWYLDSGG